MSRKHFIHFAKMLAALTDRNAAEKQAQDMIHVFRADNPKFDESKFRAMARL